jgi:hypothetical protein
MYVQVIATKDPTSHAEIIAIQKVRTQILLAVFAHRSIAKGLAHIVFLVDDLRLVAGCCLWFSFKRGNIFQSLLTIKSIGFELLLSEVDRLWFTSVAVMFLRVICFLLQSHGQRSANCAAIRPILSGWF